ncbi:MAG: amidohydrolase family protein [Methanolinea sp.]|jgi:cytosine/adenosine deaminase-related metal-dependent hydrolase|nr:amidohydrolase family protein [Methanolinea sp.]
MAGGELLVEGRALLGEELEEAPVTVVVKDGIIHRIEHLSGNTGGIPWICPAFFNAHTHLGDSLAMDIPLTGSLDDLVKPPDGLKHRILRSATHDELVKGMRLTLRTMADSGTAGCADFREGGVEGVKALLQAGEGIPCRTIIFGREGGEDIAQGLGISSARDVKEGLEAMVSSARRSGRLVAFHSGERDAGDVDTALEYTPDLLIHCTHATRSQLRRIADMGIPVAVCPRANWRFGVTKSPDHPPVQTMLALGCRILLGTDNAMCVQPDMWREAHFLSTIYGTQPRDALMAATFGSSLFTCSFYLKEGNMANFLLVDPGGSNLGLSRDMVGALVNRAGPGNIVRKVINL